MRDLGLTLAGGGNRSFYQQALLEAWGERIWPRVAAMACSSAGAAIATLLLASRAHEARTYWDGLRRGITKNVDVARLLRGETLAPHGAIYRATILHGMAEGGLARLQATPFPVFVLCAELPASVPTALAVALGLGGYALEKLVAPRSMHPRTGPYLGFRSFVFDARDCQTAEEVADLVLASSSTPPFTPIGSFRGRRMLDGGVIDNVPASLVESTNGVKQNLILLTRRYPKGVAGAHGRRLYLEPSAPVPIHRWDYRESAGVDDAIALGRGDAERYLPRVKAWLADEPSAHADPQNFCG